MKACAQLLLLSVCAFFVAAVQAEELPIMIRYSGTATDSLDLADTIIIAEADAQGSFGAMRIKTTSKFTPFVPQASCAATEIPLEMDHARSVTTFKDHSQMFAFWDSGWICVTPGLAGQASYRGSVAGHIVGGTGRFVGATGNVETLFDGIDVSGPFVAEGPFFPGLGSWTGDLSGTVVFAD